ncbi:MAG: nucleotidyltransferase family protein [Acutalibacteraceae bacterium]
MQTQVYSIDEIREIVAPIAKQHGVDKVFLFGSYARGDATPASDVDLCVDAHQAAWSVCPRRSVCRPGRRAQKEH